MTTCSDCGVTLVSALPEREEQEDGAEVLNGPLIQVPLGSASDVALVQTLLQSAGFPYHVNPGFGEVWDQIFVREEDVPAIKEFLKEYRSQQGLRTERLPIPW